MLIVRSLLFGAVFYVNTAVFLIGGSWLLLAPRSWAMAPCTTRAAGDLPGTIPMAPFVYLDSAEYWCTGARSLDNAVRRATVARDDRVHC